MEAQQNGRGQHLGQEDEGLVQCVAEGQAGGWMANRLLKKVPLRTPKIYNVTTIL